jgi:hypothetical protein
LVRLQLMHRQTYLLIRSLGTGLLGVATGFFLAEIGVTAALAIPAAFLICAVWFVLPYLTAGLVAALAAVGSEAVLKSSGLSAGLSVVLPVAIGAALALAAMFSTAVLRLAFADRHDASEDDGQLGTDAEGAFVEVGNAEALAKLVERLFWEKEAWIFRRVEKITFEDRTTVRRHISLDFEVPDVHLASGDSHEKSYVPVSVLRSWPPVHNFDLRDGSGAILPLLSRKTTNALDLTVLRRVAQWAMGDSAMEVSDQLQRIVYGAGRRPRDAYRVLRSALEDEVLELPPDNAERYERFLDLAAVMCDSTMLWIEVDRQDPGARRVIKLAYDEPVRSRLFRILSVLNSLSWRSVIVAFDVPHIGDANSYHLEIDAPAPLEMVMARLDLSSDEPFPTAIARFRHRLAGFQRSLSAALLRRLHRPPLPLQDAEWWGRHVEIVSRRAHLYVSGNRPRAYALATVSMLPQRRGVLTASAVSTLLIAGVVSAFHHLAPYIYSAAIAKPASTALFSVSVSFMLLTPALLTYVLLKGPEHPLAQHLFVGVRVVVTAAVLTATTAAGALIWSVATRDPHALQTWSLWSMRATWVLAAMAAWSLIWPPRRTWRRTD